LLRLVRPFRKVLICLLPGVFALGAVPWSWAVRTLDTRREELAFLGIATLLATAALFLAG
jgi:hypothetical protein